MKLFKVTKKCETFGHPKIIHIVAHNYTAVENEEPKATKIEVIEQSIKIIEYANP